MVTIYQVSEKAGVSLASVSRVINGNTKVSDKTRDKVLKAMDELGYQPNTIAQSLASKCSNSVGLLVSELNGSFFGNIMQSVEHELRSAGKHVIITAGMSQEKTEKEAINFLISRRCDALILHIDAVSEAFLLDLDKKNIPFVIINDCVEPLKDRCFYLDNERAGYLATKLVLDNGHKKVGYVSGPELKEDSRLRKKGHLQALKESGIEIGSDLLFTGDFREASGEDAVRHFFSGDKQITALVCANDEMALGAMNEARKLGIVVPDQLSIVGFDNVSFSRLLYPALTTINNPVKDMGRNAAFWVLKNVYQQKNLEIQNCFQPTIVERATLISLD
jgi:LacI family transcriptional regulator